MVNRVILLCPLGRQAAVLKPHLPICDGQLLTLLRCDRRCVICSAARLAMQYPNLKLESRLSTTQLASMAFCSGNRQCGSSKRQSRLCYGLFSLPSYEAHLDVTCSNVVYEQLLSLGPEIQIWFGGMVEEGPHAQREKIVAPGAEEVVLQGGVPGSTQDQQMSLPMSLTVQGSIWASQYLCGKDLQRLHLGA